MSLVQFLFSFHGRVRRLHLWLFFIVLSLLHGGLLWQFGTVHVAREFNMHDAWYGHGYTFTAFGHNPFFGVFALVVTWMNLAVVVKRWHDRGKSGWWVLITFVPVIGWLWQLVECGFMDGTQGPNRYGPSPKAIAAAERAF